jgi:tRNA (guanine37-N1)-methyltransferase
MIRIDIISAVPQVLDSPLNHSIVGNAQDDGFVEIHTHDLHDYTEDKHNKVDDYPYGGGAGMVLTPQPIFSCIEHLQSQRDYDEIIFTAPNGKPFKQDDANRLSTEQNLIFLCGHYKGVDQRVIDAFITKTYSIGDYVLSGGELPTLVMVDSIVRVLPGVLGDAESALTDSFQNENLLEGPVYTRPADFKGMEVPQVLRSGDHQKVKEWRHQQSLERTKNVRPDIFKKFRNEQQ